MRKYVVEESRDKDYIKQKELVNNKGWDVTPLRARTFYDMFKILSSGDCPDNQKPGTFARTSDFFRFDDDYDNDIVHQSAMGGFVPRVGAHVTTCSGFDYGRFGVVPCIQAEVLRLKALESSSSLT